MKKVSNYGLVILLAACVMCCVSCLKKCEPGETQPGYCPDGTVTEQVCKDDGSGWEPADCTNKYSYWNDPATNLTWQDPQKDAYTPDDPGVGQQDALRYCEELVLGGYDDWRLPDIDELRTIIRGNPDTMTGGECPVHDGSSRADMKNPACGAVADYQGPGDGGCYWAPELTGPCNRPDPADEGIRPLETVSSTVASDDRFWVGCVLFDEGAAVFNHIYSLADVRCIRNGPTNQPACTPALFPCMPGKTRRCLASNFKTGSQVCSEDGSCWGPCDSTKFTPSPPITDISDQCDQVNLTIQVPVKLSTPPKLLMAFLYKVEDWTFPPGRPPDGGTQDNQIIDPVIDIDKPLKLTVPSCSYYRDRCIPGGDYYLYVSLLQSNAWPPLPQAGDYVWGEDQEPMTLQSGQQQVIEKEIMLVPYGE